MDGALVLDKPTGITSHDAVAAARRLLSEPRIGHLGTLDPFASGVLVLLLGRATRLARFYRDREKSYLGTIRFGFSTTTYDCDGEAMSPERSELLQSLIAKIFRGMLSLSCHGRATVKTCFAADASHRWCHDRQSSMKPEG